MSTEALVDSGSTATILSFQVDLTFSWQGKTVWSPVYVRSDNSGGGELCLLMLMMPAPGVEPKR